MICSWSAVHEDYGVFLTDDLGEEGNVSDRNCRHGSTPIIPCTAPDVSEWNFVHHIGKIGKKFPYLSFDY
jgi:hypothetical protein